MAGHTDVSGRQAQIDAVPWYHDFDFGGGLRARSRTPDADGHRRNWAFLEEQLAAVDFRGKTVLDVGCWDGWWSFYAEGRGARSVLASDDVSQNWSAGRGLLLACELLGSRVEVNQHLSVYDLAGLGRRFDVILFLGVYYHLFDPFYALTQIRHCCHAGSRVLIEGAEAFGLPPGGIVFDPGRPAGKFLPTAGALEAMLRAAYFSVTARHVMPFPPGFMRRGGWRWRLDACRQALRGSLSGLGECLGRWTVARRVFLTCTPFAGENPAHSYSPPFGLHAYDPRFAGSVSL
jgi:tRNA (mo5U34)-methyltransferase